MCKTNKPPQKKISANELYLYGDTTSVLPHYPADMQPSECFNRPAQFSFLYQQATRFSYGFLGNIYTAKIAPCDAENDAV